MKTPAAKLEFPLSDSIGAMVRMTHQAFTRDLQRHLAEHDIPVGMWFYLRALWEEDKLTQRELSRRVGATEPTTAQQLVKMEARGYITRQRAQSDRRTSHVSLTRRGRALKARLLPYAVAVNETAVDGLKASEVRQLRILLEKVRARLEQREEALANDAAGAVSPSRETRAPAQRRSATGSAAQERS